MGASEHEPYGERLSGGLNWGYTPYHEFTGKPMDSALGAYYFPYRYYNPVASRWLTPDPAGLIDGPNVYGYVMGNPVNKYDPLGLAYECTPTNSRIGCLLTGGKIWKDPGTGIIHCCKPRNRDRCQPPKSPCEEKCETDYAHDAMQCLIEFPYDSIGKGTCLKKAHTALEVCLLRCLEGGSQ